MHHRPWTRATASACIIAVTSSVALPALAVLPTHDPTPHGCDLSIAEAALTQAADRVGFTPTQRTAALELLRAAEADLAPAQAQWQVMAEAMFQHRFKKAPEPSARQVAEAEAACAQARDRAERTLLADLTTLLTDDQRHAAGCDAGPEACGLAYALRRARELNDGSLPGERVDLFRLARDHAFDPLADARIAPLIRDWESALDAALRQRQAVHAAAWKEMQRLREADARPDLPLPDAQVPKATADRCLAAARAVRDLTRRSAGAIEAALTPAEARRWRRAYRITAYDSDLLHLRSASDYVFAAMSLKDLTPEQSARLEDIAADLDRRVKPLLDELIRFTDCVREGGDACWPHKTEPWDHQRARLDTEHAAALKVQALLTPAQQSRMPSLEKQ